MEESKNLDQKNDMVRENGRISDLIEKGKRISSGKNLLFYYLIFVLNIATLVVAWFIVASKNGCVMPQNIFSGLNFRFFVLIISCIKYYS